MIRFEALDNGNVLVIVDEVITRSFPPNSFIGVHKSKEDVIRIDADPAGGNSFVTFEFNASQVESPVHYGRNDLMRKLSGEYFNGGNGQLISILQATKSNKLTLEKILDELKTNNKYLRKIYAH